METTTARSEVGVFLDRYEERDHTASKKLLDLRADMDAGRFLSHIREELLERPASAALKFAVSLLKFGEVVEIVFKIFKQSREQGIALAKKLQLADPRFDTMLFQHFGDKRAIGWSDTAFLSALDLLDAVSERDRLVLGVSKFLQDTDPAIRSRASLFIARRRPTVVWATDISREPNALVRACILEGLFEAREDFVGPLFLKYTTDLSPSVAANAMLGLYRLGDTGAMRLIDDMARDSRPDFRACGAWIMGQTGDPRFVSGLAGQLSDPDEQVRKKTLLALGEIKRASYAARGQSVLRAVILKGRVEQDRRQVIVSVCKTSGETVRGILATKFILKVGDSYPREYGFHEYTHPSHINAGFIRCEPPRGENISDVDFEEALEERCFKLRRTRDKLAFAKLTHETHLRCYATDARATTSILSRAIGNINFALPGLNLVLIGTTPHTRVVDKLIELASHSGARVHVIAVSPEWRLPELRKRVHEGGGYFLTAEPDGIIQSCLDIYSTLQHHYRINWEKSAGSVEIEIRSPDGTGLAVFEPERMPGE